MINQNKQDLIRCRESAHRRLADAHELARKLGPKKKLETDLLSEALRFHLQDLNEKIARIEREELELSSEHRDEMRADSIQYAKDRRLQ